jgi:hypothetical protein
MGKSEMKGLPWQHGGINVRFTMTWAIFAGLAFGEFSPAGMRILLGRGSRARLESEFREIGRRQRLAIIAKIITYCMNLDRVETTVFGLLGDRDHGGASLGSS